MSKKSKGFPVLFQAGMGSRVSSWVMARIVSMLGALGVVSSVGLRTVMIEEVRRGNQKVIEMAKRFPFPGHIEELLAFAKGCKWHKKPVPMDQFGPKGELAKRLSTIAAFIEVSLAKEGHNGLIGINVMWKLPLTVLPVIYGAMLAGVNIIIAGAGVPMELPAIVEAIRSGQDLAFKLGTDAEFTLRIVPGTSELISSRDRPKLAPILSNFVFCRKLKDGWKEKYGVEPDFFILEDYKAGGHNAPPRNKEVHSVEKDGIDSYFDEVVELGIPVVVAGAFEHGGTRADLLYWQKRGAHGIQVGSRFALSSDSGMLEIYRHQILELNKAGKLEIITRMSDSPTGYPIKMAVLQGTLADPEIYRARRRACKQGYLREVHTYTDESGQEVQVLSCKAMPLDQYMALNPDKTREQCEEDSDGKVCLCDGLLGAIGFKAVPAYITLGESGRIPTEEESAREIALEILTPRDDEDTGIDLRLAA